MGGILSKNKIAYGKTNNNKKNIPLEEKEPESNVTSVLLEIELNQFQLAVKILTETCIRQQNEKKQKTTKTSKKIAAVGSTILYSSTLCNICLRIVNFLTSKQIVRNNEQRTKYTNTKKEKRNVYEKKTSLTFKTLVRIIRHEVRV